MGWGTYFTTEIELRSETFRNLADVKEAVLDLEEDIEWYKRRIYMYASADVDKAFPDEETPIEMLHIELNNLFRDLEEDMYKLFRLRELERYLVENPEIDVKTLNSDYIEDERRNI